MSYALDVMCLFCFCLVVLLVLDIVLDWLLADVVVICYACWLWVVLGFCCAFVLVWFAGFCGAWC